MITRASIRRHGRKYRRLPFLLCAACVGTALAAEPGSDVVARLGTTDITLAAMRDFFQSLDPATRKQAAADPQVLSRLVRLDLIRMAVLQEAKSKNWDQQPDVIAQIARARDQVIVTSYLASLTTPPQDFPSEAQIEAAYDSNRDAFMEPRQYRLEQIFISVPSGSDKKTEASAEKKAAADAKTAKEKGANFAAFARQESDIKSDLPDVGWVPEDRLVPEIRSAVAGMSVGEVSAPIRSKDGWHIVHMLDTKPAGPRPSADVKDKVVAALRQRKQQENEQAYVQGLLEKTPIVVNEIGLRKILDTTP